ncbi:MAG: aminotransferase class III-fold pyridoxal phosphate-dependent enzyme, partial [Cyanobacteria bacterium K_Offshore_surface_m2_239]|nr:aminotransferase class III-fold pyridoxal phosphate-dependent enzyme [Cyanobacteria bacterium K_Offshore_surface_m2_239]
NPVGKQVQRLCMEQGVYLRPLGNVVYLLPPLCISEAQLQQCYSAIHQAIHTLVAEQQ